MALKMAAISDSIFSDALFTMCSLGFGHGEDTVLSRRLHSRGALFLVPGAVFHHPNTDSPKAYATEAFRLGMGVAWSRRLINTNFRWPGRPTLADRSHLLGAYVLGSCLHALSALASLRRDRARYALGYVIGSFRGLIQPPSAASGRTRINWRMDAQTAIRRLHQVR